MKLNCWEIKKCGREEGGINAKEFGVCPAYSCEKCDGINNGRHAGRFCWAVTGTFCGGKIQGAFAQKHMNCMACDFFRLVKEEEKDNFRISLL